MGPALRGYPERRLSKPAQVPDPRQPFPNTRRDGKVWRDTHGARARPIPGPPMRGGPSPCPRLTFADIPQRRDTAGGGVPKGRESGPVRAGRGPCGWLVDRPRVQDKRWPASCSFASRPARRAGGAQGQQPSRVERARVPDAAGQRTQRWECAHASSPKRSRGNERLEAAGSVPLPQGLTPHKLRHTFCSLLVALGSDPGVVMNELGHTDSGFTLRVYRHSTRREQDSREQLRALVGALQLAPNGTSGQSEGSTLPVASNGHPAKAAQ
jgi:hypothetical protein